jgi:hypothetical protein
VYKYRSLEEAQALHERWRRDASQPAGNVSARRSGSDTPGASSPHEA